MADEQAKKERPTFEFGPTEEIEEAMQAEAKEKRKILYKVDIEERGIRVLCFGPTRDLWKRYMQATTADDRKKYDLSVNLLSQCMVWPKAKSAERDELNALYDCEPVIETSLALNFVLGLQKGYEGEGKKLESSSS